MAIRYFYVCNVCQHEYMEQRKNDMNQIMTICNGCRIGTYVEVDNKFSYAVIGDNGIVTNMVFAKLQDEAETIAGANCIKADDFNIGDTYDSKWNVFIPIGLVYEPISKRFMTPQEKAEL